MLDILPFSIFCFLTLFHIYMGFGGPINTNYFFPSINGESLPFHATMALPVALLLLLTTISFGFNVQLLPNTILGSFNSIWLLLSAIALVFRGIFGCIVFHLLNKVIDDTAFKTWDYRLYSPLTLYLGGASFSAFLLN